MTVIGNTTGYIATKWFCRHPDMRIPNIAAVMGCTFYLLSGI
jgi:hypothetical protein